MSVPSNALIAVDVGNSAIKCGFFADRPSREASEPDRILRLPPHLDGFDQFLRQLSGHPHDWWISSVQKKLLQNLLEQISESRACDRVTLLSHDHFPVHADVEFPQHLGTDRLAAACATNFLRETSSPAIVIDAGSATTIDLIDRAGVFQGGVILPGARIMSAALADHTDRLPRVAFPEEATPPSPIGKNTEAAIRSGLFWGQVGAVKQVVKAISRDLAGHPQLFLCGGQASCLAAELAAAHYIPYLVLSGIALCTIE